MSERKLDIAFASVTLQSGALDYAKRAALRSTASAELLAEIGLPSPTVILVKERRKRVLQHFDDAYRQMRRQGFVQIVSAFEFDLFRLIEIASSKARHVLDQHYAQTGPFVANRRDLVRTVSDFSNLGGYKRLLASTSAAQGDPRADLWSVVSHRDFLVHGERWNAPANPPTIEAAYRVLSDELDRVGTGGSTE